MKQRLLLIVIRSVHKETKLPPARYPYQTSLVETKAKSKRGQALITARVLRLKQMLTGIASIAAVSSMTAPPFSQPSKVQQWDKQFQVM